jgi:hypothetical protein
MTLRHRYNPVMSPVPLSLDTPPDIEHRQIEAWRRMSPAEKAAIVSGLTRAAYDLARAASGRVIQGPHRADTSSVWPSSRSVGTWRGARTRR